MKYSFPYTPSTRKTMTASTSPFVLTAFAPRDITDSERYENYQSNLATLKQLEKAEVQHEQMLGREHERREGHQRALARGEARARPPSGKAVDAALREQLERRVHV